MNEFTKMLDAKPYYKFQAFLGEQGQRTKRNVGMAFMKDDNSSYCLRLWSFMNERFYIVPKRGSSKEFLIMTREANRLPNPKTQYLWNVVGSASTIEDNLRLSLKFDLFEKTIFMNLIPEKIGRDNDFKSNDA